MENINDTKSRARACLLSGALGDAIGGVVEFMGLHEITGRFGDAGIVQPEFSTAYGRVGAITDDTQMTLFTVEGMIRAKVRQDSKGICAPESVIHHAYLRWLATQDVVHKLLANGGNDGWLIKNVELHSRRAPGNTCLEALSAPVAGFGEPAINNSKGCGAVMRVAPIGIALGSDAAFDLGVQSGRLTHAHPSGYLSAGAFAAIISLIFRGESIERAAQTTFALLIAQEESGEVVNAIETAIRLAKDESLSSHEAIAQLGLGWVGEEALAIGLYSALRASNTADGILLAVNHDGDSDSTGSIAGNILGCVHGEESIPAEWLEVLELRDVICQLAVDLVDAFDPLRSADTDEMWARYPGW